MKRQLLAGIVFSLLCLWLAVRGADLDEVKRALATARYDVLAWTLVPTMGSFAIRAWRWRYLLRPVRTVRFAPLFSATMIGFFGNNVLPARLGELLRAYVVGQRGGFSRAAALASIVVERVFDTFLLLAVFAGVLLSHRLPHGIGGWGISLIVLTFPVYALLWFFRRRSEPFLALLERWIPVGRREQALQFAKNFRIGLGVLEDREGMAMSLALSALMWGCLSLVVSLCFFSLGLDLPPAAAFVVLVVMAVGTMAPSAPGFVGTLQYAATVGLAVYDVDASRALSFSVLYHVSQWVPTTVVGLFCLLREHVDLRVVAPSSGAPGGGSSNPDGTE